MSSCVSCRAAESDERGSGTSCMRTRQVPPQQGVRIFVVAVAVYTFELYTVRVVLQRRAVPFISL